MVSYYLSSTLDHKHSLGESMCYMIQHDSFISLQFEMQHRAA